MIIIFFCFISLNIFANDYICINTRYTEIDSLGEHAFISIIKNVPAEDQCDGKLECYNTEDITTYSLWGGRFQKWKMIKDYKHNHFTLGDEIILNQKNINFIRHCEIINDSDEVRTHFNQKLEEMENFNSLHKDKLHWGKYWGAYNFNCTSFSIKFFNEITGSNYSALHPYLNVETPALLAKEIMQNKKEDNLKLIEEFKGQENLYFKSKREALEDLKENMIIRNKI